MKEFRLLLKTLGESTAVLEPLRSVRSELKSLRLRQLLSFDDEVMRLDSGTDEPSQEEVAANPDAFSIGTFPSSFKTDLQRFNELIIWKKVANTKDAVEIPEPKSGIDPNFDKAN